MAVESITRLFTVLGQGEGSWDEILGTPESGWIEFKSEPYRLGDHKQKLELAKDVSAIANTAAGVIVIGITTERNLRTSGDVASEIPKVPVSQVNIDQIRDVISRYTYPPIEGVDCRPHSDPDSEQGLVSISIPEQPDHEKYFIVTEGVSEEGAVKGNMIGVFRRDGDRVVPLKGEYLQELIREGRRVRRIEQSTGVTMSRLEAMALQIATSERVILGTGFESVERQAEDDIESAGLGGETVFLVQAWHEPGFDMTAELQRRGPHGFRTLFERPPQLRANGFNLDIYGDIEVLPGGGLRTVRAEIAAFSVLPSGVCTFVVGGHFLGWATEQRFGENSEAINPLVLAESTAEFCRFVSKEVSPRSTAGGRATFRSSLRNLDKDGFKRLALGFGQGWNFVDTKDAPDGVDEITSVEVREPDPEKAAFELLSSIYSNYGAPPDDIPWVDVDSGRIDFQRLAQG